MNASIGELEAGLAKVKLANRLGCKTQELTTVQVECPKGKLGVVIGKNGAMINKIMEMTKVSIDVRKEDSKIYVTGSASSVAAAVAEIDKITLATEDQFEISKELITYLTAREVSVIRGLRDQYSDIYLDVIRNNQKISVRGAPDKVGAVKSYLLGLDIVQKKRSLAGREVQTLVGRKGATIDKLTAEHKVAIDVEKVDDKTSTSYITGPPTNVEAAMNEIEKMMNENREVVEPIEVNPLIRRFLIAESGKSIKAIQTKVNKELKEANEELKEAGGNIYLSFDKDNLDKDRPELLVKSKHITMATAFELVEASLKEIDAFIVHLSIDPYIVPKIIGKGGETLKKLTAGKQVFVEVDSASGKISVGAAIDEERESVLREVKEIIANNKLLRVDADATMMKAQYRELTRSKTKAKISALSRIDSDEQNGQFTFQGTEENNQKAKDLLLEFLSNNYFEEVAVTEEDMDALLSGGKQSKIVQLSAELKISLSVDRNRYVIIVRGSDDKVKATVERLIQFLNGGDGHSVAKITVIEQLVGVVIGKGGKTRKELEEKHEGVSINISKSHRISIRGPEDNVSACRVEMLKMVASARVTQTVAVTEEQHKTLEKNDTIKRTMQGVPVQINISDGTAIIRGYFHDVRDAVSLLNEQLTGVYSSAMELDAAQFSKARGACRDPGHFERIETTSGAKVTLDLSAGSIVISGKRSNVKKAKDDLFLFLDFLLPNEFARVKISKPLQSVVGQATTLAEISANSGGSTVYLDRDLSSIIVHSSDTDKVVSATKLVEEKIKEGEKLAYVLQIDPSEAWLIPVIVGKNGVQMSALQKSGCFMHVSKESRTVTVTGRSEEAVATAKESLISLVEKARKENLCMPLTEEAIPSFVGKGGAHIREISKKHGVDIQLMRKGHTGTQLKITGNESSVTSAKKEIDEWIAARDDANGSITILANRHQLQAVIGNKGETALSLRDEFSCRIDIDWKALNVTVRGGIRDRRENAVEKIKSIMAQAAAPKPEALPQEPREAPHTRERVLSKDSTSKDEFVAKANRGSEYPTQPVGLTIAPKRERNKKDAAVDSLVQTGTAAGWSLFQLLVSDPEAAYKVVPAGNRKASYETWDSSTVSSGAASPGE
jgi:predicted PilT family ATPase